MIGIGIWLILGISLNYLIQIKGDCPSNDTLTTSHIVHETNCSKFYVCDNGRKVELSCPDNLFFNSKENKCDWYQNVECTTTDGLTPETRSLTFESHENNCSKFYMYVNKVKTEHKCPEGLHFNIIEEVCDYPWNARCDLEHSDYNDKNLYKMVITHVEATYENV